MKSILNAIWWIEMGCIIASAFVFYGKYNYLKGRISKSKEIENGNTTIYIKEETN